MSFIEDMIQVPARFSIVNLSTNEELVAQLNPTEFEDEVNAEHARITTPGGSRQHHHFTTTSNYTVPMELLFRAYTEAEYDEINKARRTIQSWCYPQGATQDTPGKGPPILLATWPRVFSIECYLMRCKIKYLRFAPDGRCTRFTANVQFEQTGDKRLTMESIAAELEVRGESDEAAAKAANEMIRRFVDIEGR
jgi:hypothetical protein